MWFRELLWISIVWIAWLLLGSGFRLNNISRLYLYPFDLHICLPHYHHPHYPIQLFLLLQGFMLWILQIPLRSCVLLYSSRIYSLNQYYTFWSYFKDFTLITANLSYISEYSLPLHWNKYVQHFLYQKLNFSDFLYSLLYRGIFII